MANKGQEFLDRRGSVIDLQDLFGDLGRLQAKVGKSVILRALKYAAEPAAILMEQRAPKGTQEHVTYDGVRRLPGYLSRSIRVRSGFNRKTGRFEARIGVLKPAFYGIQFYDRLSSISISTRKKGKYSGHPVHFAPYTLRPHPWFSSSFYSVKDQMIDRFVSRVRQNTDSALKRQNRVR